MADSPEFVLPRAQVGEIRGASEPEKGHFHRVEHRSGTPSAESAYACTTLRRGVANASLGDSDAGLRR
jgi:hypothetical protein